jgi:Protein of unknown function (DUF3304)
MHSRSAVTLLMAALITAACTPNETAGPAAARAGPEPQAKATAAPSEVAASAIPRSSQDHYSLGIVGYNYTDLYISYFIVNGTNGFNLGVSNEGSGGGKTSCCFGWAPGAPLPKPITVEWSRDGGNRWCRQKVMLNAPVPLEPTTLEVHFYPDGHIEAAMTDIYSSPRLKLKAAGSDYRYELRIKNVEAAVRAVDEKTSECRDGDFLTGRKWAE